MPRKFNIFLSHITVESSIADLIKQRLIHDFIGLVDVFESSDRYSIPAGSKWLNDVMEALKRADMHLVLCSGEAQSRPWIQFEAGAAQIRGIPIVPLLHSGLTPAQLRVPLSENEGIQLTDPGGLEKIYRRIAAALGSDLPSVDFITLGAQFRELEKRYESQRSSIELQIDTQASLERVRNPNALCISSRQFRELGYQNQIERVLNAFPAVVAHETAFSSKELLDLIMANRKFDIVHIAAFVCPRSGDLYFSEVDLRSGARISSEADVLGADRLASLLEEAGAKLVVIGSCDSLALGLALMKVCHVVAARDMVSSKMMAAWVETFYSRLPKQSLLQALDAALTVSQAPMRFYPREVRSVDMVFIQDDSHESAIPTNA